MAKDRTYHFEKLKSSVLARLPGTIFRTWDPLTTWLEALARRAAEISADILQTENDFYIDSAAGTKLDRRLGVNEGILRVLARPADDGTVTLGRSTPPVTTTTFPVGSLIVAPPPDPAKPPGNRPTYTNTVPLTIGPGATSWAVTFQATRGGADTNLPAGTPLQIVTQATLLDTAVVAAPFTTGTEDETDDTYRQRGKLMMRSRSKGTEDALIAAALNAGAVFAYTVEDFDVGHIPVTLYAAGPDGTLTTGLRQAIFRNLNGDPTANPPVEAARAKGVPVDVQPAAAVTFDFSIGLVLQPWVVDLPGDPKLTRLRADIEAVIAAYVRSLNVPGVQDRVMRINRVKDICLSFRGRGVLDVSDGVFLPETSTELSNQEMAAMGVITWL